MLKIFGWLWRSILFLLGIDLGMRGTSNVDRDAELKSQFKLISHEVISDMQKTFLATAELQFKAQQQLNDTDLANKKNLIDQRLDAMTRDMAKVTEYIPSPSASLNAVAAGSHPCMEPAIWTPFALTVSRDIST